MSLKLEDMLKSAANISRKSYESSVVTRAEFLYSWYGNRQRLFLEKCCIPIATAQDEIEPATRTS